MNNAGLTDKLKFISKYMTDLEITKVLETLNIYYNPSLSIREKGGALIPEILEGIASVYEDEYSKNEKDVEIDYDETFEDDDPLDSQQKEVILKDKSSVGTPEVDQDLLRANKEMEKMKIEIEKAKDPTSEEYSVIQYLKENAPFIKKKTVSLTVLNNIVETPELIKRKIERGEIPHIIFIKKTQTMGYHEFAIGRVV